MPSETQVAVATAEPTAPFARTGDSRRQQVHVQPLHAAQIADALLHIGTVRALTSLSPATIYRKVAAGEFPSPIKLGPRCARWRSGDVMAWLVRAAAGTPK
jgi:prophage regulatory protein